MASDEKPVENPQRLFVSSMPEGTGKKGLIMFSLIKSVNSRQWFVKSGALYGEQQHSSPLRIRSLSIQQKLR
jgi:hypothetical protein